VIELYVFSPTFPFPSFPISLSLPFFPFLLTLLFRNRLLKSSYVVWGSDLSFPSGEPHTKELGVLRASGGNNFNDFPRKKSTDQTKALPGGGVTTLGSGTANYFIFRL